MFSELAGLRQSREHSKPEMLVVRSVACTGAKEDLVVCEQPHADAVCPKFPPSDFHGSIHDSREVTRVALYFLDLEQVRKRLRVTPLDCVSPQRPPAHSLEET